MKRSEQEKKAALIAILLNISALCYFLFILLGVLVPLGVWIFTKDKYSTVDEVGRRILNFQICWCLLIFYVFAMMFLVPTFVGVGMLAVTILYAINVCFIIFNSIRSYLGK